MLTRSPAVIDDGYVLCGTDDAQTGVSCTDCDACCFKSQRCCFRDHGSTGCCDLDALGVIAGPCPVQGALGRSPSHTPGLVNPDPGTVPTPLLSLPSGGSGHGSSGDWGGGGSTRSGPSPLPSQTMPLGSPCLALSPLPPLRPCGISAALTTAKGERGEALAASPETTVGAVGSASPIPSSSAAEKESQETSERTE